MVPISRWFNESYLLDIFAPALFQPEIPAERCLTFL